MGDGTGIEWTDATWNPLRGCSRVSEGCRNCYAERVAARFGAPGQPYEGLTRSGRWTGDVRLVPEVLALPLRWRRPRRIFVNSMSDLFHESVSNETITAIFGVMAACPKHTFQVLTKRPARAVEWFRWAGRRGLGLDGKARERGAMSWGNRIDESSWPLPNVWLGVSVEDQAGADKRVPLLLQCPAAVRWVSAEPLIGAVDLQYGRGWLEPFKETDPSLRRTPRVDWLVCGGESGPGARPMAPQWARSLRDQCRDAGTPFVFKQWGEWLPLDQMTDDTWSDLDSRDANLVDGRRFPWGGAAPGVYRVGKKAAGRRLDGVIHDEYPKRSL